MVVKVPATIRVGQPFQFSVASARQAGVTEPAQSMIRRARCEKDGREEEGSTDEERHASQPRKW
eukprot:COSAG01_NODE_58776_length_304_cov_0.600000_1_plen_63_part_01